MKTNSTPHILLDFHLIWVSPRHIVCMLRLSRFSCCVFCFFCKCCILLWKEHGGEHKETILSLNIVVMYLWRITRGASHNMGCPWRSLRGQCMYCGHNYGIGINQNIQGILQINFICWWKGKPLTNNSMQSYNNGVYTSRCCV